MLDAITNIDLADAGIDGGGRPVPQSPLGSQGFSRFLRRQGFSVAARPDIKLAQIEAA